MDTFTYRASDGVATSGTVAVTITVSAVNDTPLALDDSWTVLEDGVLTVAPAGVLANDSDIDGDALQAVLVDAPTLGLLTLTADGSFVYEPFPNVNGVDFFTYRASDGQAESLAARATLTVTSVGDAPVALPDAYLVVGGFLDVSHLEGVLANDLDADGDALTTELVTDVRRGTLVLGPKGAITYRPEAGFVGLDRFSYRATDGILDSNTVEVVLTVSP